jgi:hypothetical protein
MARLLILIILLSSCSAEWHLKKAIKKDPEIVSNILIYKYDTLWTNSIRLKDSVSIDFRDSVLITNDTIVIKLKKTANNNISVDAKVVPYPIYRKVTQYKTVIKQREKKLESFFWQIVLATIVVLGSLKIINKSIE